MCSRTRENNKNKVDPMIWHTLYNIYIYMQNLLNSDEEKKINDTKIVLKDPVNGDLCANGTHSPLNSFI